jgi:mannose-6-phosphate isomerase
MKSILYPLVFRPILKERVWGGRELERLFNKKLPPVRPIGESWEISDRPGDESIVASGSFAGNTLR